MWLPRATRRATFYDCAAVPLGFTSKLPLAPSPGTYTALQWSAMSATWLLLALLLAGAHLLAPADSHSESHDEEREHAGSGSVGGRMRLAWQNLMATPRTISVVALGARGDGHTDDSAAFRKAFAWADGGGGGETTIFVPCGRYLVDGEWQGDFAVVAQVGVAAVSLRGEGSNCTVLVAGRAHPPAGQTPSIVFFTGKPGAIVSNFSARGLAFESNSYLGKPNTRGYGWTPDFRTGTAFSFETFHNVSIRACAFRNMAGMAFLGAESVMQSSSLEFAENAVDGGDLFTASGVHVYNVAGARVENNTFIRVARPFDLELGDAMHRTVSDAIFAGNTVRQGNASSRSPDSETYGGVHLLVHPNTSSSIFNVWVENNLFDGGIDGGQGGVDITISNHDFESGSIRDIAIRNNTVSGRQQARSFSSSLWLEALSFVHVEGNTFDAPASRMRGIYLRDVSDVVIVGNQVVQRYMPALTVTSRHLKSRGNVLAANNISELPGSIELEPGSSWRY